MKKKVCLAMSLLMLAGTVPAQAETIGEAEQITFTAKVGTKELYRNQSRISLDAAIYIKDGYAMLPLRAFLTSIDNGTMHWATGEYGRLRHREEQHYGERRADRSKRKDGHSGWTDFCATTELEKYSEWL